MIRKLATSPVNAEMPLATIKISTSGLRNRLRNFLTTEVPVTGARTFGPNRTSLACASAAFSPAAPLPSVVSSSAKGTSQNAALPSLPALSDIASGIVTSSARWKSRKSPNSR